MVLVILRFGTRWMFAAVAAVVVFIGLFQAHSSIVHLFVRFTPQFALLFAMGIVAAGIVVARPDVRRLPWPWYALIAFVPVAIVIAAKGSVWTVDNYYWMDIAIGPTIALLLASMATGRPKWLIGFFDSRPLRELGSFSYSLYLIHAPIVVAVHEKIVAPRTGLSGFLMTLAIAVPLSLVAARLFAAVFELPFTRHRNWRELRAAMHVRAERLPAVGS